MLLIHLLNLFLVYLQHWLDVTKSIKKQVKSKLYAVFFFFVLFLNNRFLGKCCFGYV